MKVRGSRTPAARAAAGAAPGPRRVAVLTARAELEIYRELAAAGARAGVVVEVLDALALTGATDPPALLRADGGLPLDGLAAVLPRVGNWRPDSLLAVLESLCAAGVPALNEPDAIRRGRDHWRTVLALAAAGVPHPETVAGADPERLAGAAAHRLGLPCVVKTRQSRQGLGVVLCSSRDQLDATLDAMFRLGEEVVVQRLCGSGLSRRVLVLAGAPLGATEHRAAAGEFRSNAARGAQVTAVGLDAALADLAVAAAAVLGLGFCGVDLFPDGERWVVGEVNPSPGWAHFAAATGIDVANALVGALSRCGGID